MTNPADVLTQTRRVADRPIDEDIALAALTNQLHEVLQPAMADVSVHKRFDYVVAEVHDLLPHQLEESLRRRRHLDEMMGEVVLGDLLDVSVVDVAPPFVLLDLTAPTGLPSGPSGPTAEPADPPTGTRADAPNAPLTATLPATGSFGTAPAIAVALAAGALLTSHLARRSQRAIERGER